MLNPQRQQQLNTIIDTMQANKESSKSIKMVVDEYHNRFDDVKAPVAAPATNQALFGSGARAPVTDSSVSTPVSGKPGDPGTLQDLANVGQPLRINPQVRFQPTMAGAQNAAQQAGQFAASLPQNASGYTSIKGALEPFVGSGGSVTVPGESSNAQSMTVHTAETNAKLAKTIMDQVNAGKITAEHGAKLLNQLPETAASKNVDALKETANIAGGVLAPMAMVGAASAGIASNAPEPSLQTNQPQPQLSNPPRPELEIDPNRVPDPQNHVQEMQMSRGAQIMASDRMSGIRQIGPDGLKLTMKTQQEVQDVVDGLSENLGLDKSPKVELLKSKAYGEWLKSYNDVGYTGTTSPVTSAGFISPDGETIYLNADHAQNKTDALKTIFHELSHVEGFDHGADMNQVVNQMVEMSAPRPLPKAP